MATVLDLAYSIFFYSYTRYLMYTNYTYALIYLYKRYKNTLYSKI